MNNCKTCSNSSLIVLFLYDVRAYYKFLRDDPRGGIELRGAISLLANDNFFAVINGGKVDCVTAAEVYDEAVKAQLVFVGKKSSDTDLNQKPLINLATAIAKYDIHTGKRQQPLDEDSNLKRTRRK